MEPQMDADERRLNAITEQIIACAYRVSNELGCGFLERCYRNAMLIELTHAGLLAKPEHPIKIYYRGAVIGDYVADLVVSDEVLVEIKAVKNLDDVHSAQCINYLKAQALKSAS